MSTTQLEANEVRRLADRLDEARRAVERVIVGHRAVIDDLFVCLLCEGHALLEGVPGVGKTSLIKAFSSVTGLAEQRIQFTPDLMPADIVGTEMLQLAADGSRRLEFRKGPIFANVILADEINRATPKTQSALLEAMQEQRVSVGGTRYELPRPFVVLATQNPIEMEGTYPLPEAQLDRFLFKLVLDLPSRDDLARILERTTGLQTPTVEPVFRISELPDLQRMVRAVAIAPEIQQTAVGIVRATHAGNPESPQAVRDYVRYGSSPRGAQALILAGKVYAIMDNRAHVSRADILRAAPAALRHRLILNFQADAKAVEPDEVVADVVEHARRA